MWSRPCCFFSFYRSDILASILTKFHLSKLNEISSKFVSSCNEINPRNVTQQGVFFLWLTLFYLTWLLLFLCWKNYVFFHVCFGEENKHTRIKHPSCENVVQNNQGCWRHENTMVFETSRRKECEFEYFLTRKILNVHLQFSPGICLSCNQMVTIRCLFLCVQTESVSGTAQL